MRTCNLANVFYDYFKNEIHIEEDHRISSFGSVISLFSQKLLREWHVPGESIVNVLIAKTNFLLRLVTPKTEGVGNP